MYIQIECVYRSNVYTKVYAGDVVLRPNFVNNLCICLCIYIIKNHLFQLLNFDEVGFHQNKEVSMKRFLYLVSGYIGITKLTGKDRKSTAEWGFLLGMACIAPLLLGVIESVIAKVVLQLFWGVFITRSAFLANDTWKKNKQQR